MKYMMWFAIALLSAAAYSQGLAISVATDIPGPVPIRDEEVHLLRPEGFSPLLTRDLLGLLRGDANGNGRFDDAPTDVDAIEWASGALPSLLLSVSSDTAIPGSATVKDGDIFRFDGPGVTILYPEAMFASASGSGDVDLDAFAIAADGTLFWSYSDDEVTVAPGVIAALGSSLINKHVILKLEPGAFEAVVVMTQQQVVMAFNAACGTSVSTVVNTTDIAVDPISPGDLLLTCSSTSSSLKGRVVTTAMGGSIWTFLGLSVTPTAFGLGTSPSLDGIAWMPSGPSPAIRSLSEAPSISGGGAIDLLIDGFQPGEAIRIGVSPPPSSRPAFIPVGGSFGFNLTPLDLASDTFGLSLSSPELLRIADATGTIRWQHPVGGLVPAIALVQAIGLSSGKLSTPSSVAIIL